MKLPEKNKEVSLKEIKEICEAYGLTELWSKIEKDPPEKPFESDGCSMWFDTWKITTQVDRLKLVGRRWNAGELLDTLVFSLQSST